MDKKKVIGISIFIFLILLIVGINILSNDKGFTNLKTVYVATGGGKEDFLADEEVLKILKKKYKLNVIFDTWSNGKTITKPLIRESVNLGNESIIKRIQNNEDISINTSGVSKYDALFTSDQRFYDYYKLAPNKENNEADRYTVIAGSLTLNTPIVIYSWKEVLNELYGNINIASTDPVSSSPGATYYGLLLSILSGGQIEDATLEDNLARLKQFYQKSGYMNNTPADLFERYLKTGMGGEPIIVDYEKSIIDFANSNPTGFNQVKNDIVILYPKPTIWNSHCFMAFTENGKKLYEAFMDKEIEQIAWEKYGFRTGITGGTYDVSKLGIGIPQNITSTVTSLKMDYYNKLIEYLKK